MDRLHLQQLRRESARRWRLARDLLSLARRNNEPALVRRFAGIVNNHSYAWRLVRLEQKGVLRT